MKRLVLAFWFNLPNVAPTFDRSEALAAGIGLGHLQGRAAAPVTPDTALGEDEAKRLREILDE